MQESTSVDPSELAKFANLANRWWDKTGPLKTLHAINTPRLEFIQEQVELKNKRVLDLGCGGGILAEAMAASGAYVTGLDAEAEVITVAKAHAKDLAIEYHCGLVEEYQTEAFELITCMELLEHVDDPSLILRHCQRLLKKEGLLFLSTINRNLKAYAMAVIAAEYLLGLLPRGTHDYQKFIQPAELATSLRHLGFEPLAFKGLAYNPYTGKAWLTQDVSVNYLLVARRL